MIPNHRPRKLRAPAFLAVLAALAASVSGGPPAPASAAVWETYNNANRLNTVTATGGRVWTASDLGVHRFDPATGRFTRFAKNAGQLAANAVREVEVDAQGRTWFATRGNGVSVLLPNGAWRTLTRFDGMPSDTAFCLEPSAVGMWVGTNEGVALFDGFELVAVWPDGVNPSPFASNEILDLAHAGDSTWVGTPGGAYVTRSDEGISWLRRVGGLADVRVSSLAATGLEVWCVAGGGVYRGGESGTWSPAGEGLPATTAVSIRAHGDSLLLGTTDGVFLRPDGASAWTLLGAGVPGSAAVDFGDDGSPWAGNVEGLWRWDGTSWRREDIPGPGGNNVVGLHLEGSRPWIATRERGISRFDGTSWRTYSPLPGAAPDTTLLSPDDIFMIFVDSRGTKWAGDWGNAISSLDDTGALPAFTHRFSVAEGGFDIYDTYGWSSAEDPAGNVWIGLDHDGHDINRSPKGLHRLGTDGSRATFNPQGGAAMSASQVRAIAFAPGPAFEMWVGYASFGVDVFTDPTLATRARRLTRVSGALSLLDDDVWDIQFHGDSVWVGTSSGLTRYSRPTLDALERAENVGTQAPTSRGAADPLALDAEGGVWWATKAGLYHRRPGRTVEVFTAANSPLLSDDIRALAVDHATGDVWIGTDRGVNRYNPGSSVAPPTSGVATFTTYPNPAFLSAAGVRLFGRGVDGPFEARVFDVRGRVVRSLRGNASTGGLWDATDEEGRRVAPGLYLLAVTQNGITRTGRVLLVR
jgi:ligand-binding sensor domain-containing protein